MPETSRSFLEEMCHQPDSEAWRRFDLVYRDLIRGWLRQQSFRDPDVDDITQEIMMIVLREIPQFQYDPSRGTFRSWLKGILRNRVCEHWRQRPPGAAGLGAADFESLIEQLADSSSPISQEFEREHDHHVVRVLLERVRPRVKEERDWIAFQRVVLDGIAPGPVAAELGVSLTTVYRARTKVLELLKAEGRGLID